ATSLPKKAKNHCRFRTLVTLATIPLRYLDNAQIIAFLA
ncbi:MAG: hypothetical protein ACI9NY_000596, partial [Kiritimatiellia bacterium]